jgi:hypothetical protein
LAILEPFASRTPEASNNTAAVSALGFTVCRLSLQTFNCVGHTVDFHWPSGSARSGQSLVYYFQTMVADAENVATIFWPSLIARMGYDAESKRANDCLEGQWEWARASTRRFSWLARFRPKQGVHSRSARFLRNRGAQIETDIDVCFRHAFVRLVSCF